ncbi:MAG TPA: ester cyclase [Chloroflexia bacterium]|nr:ester cyclase [Chloroflexia bacterium]
MKPEELRTLIRRFLDEVLNAHDSRALKRFCTPDFTYNMPGQRFPAKGPEGYGQFLQGYFTAFPDMRFSFDDIIVEGNRVAVRWSAFGTHKGNLGNIPPTGKHVTTSAMHFSRWNEAGMAVEAWQIGDAMGLLQQLGVIPTPSHVTA